MKLLPFQKHSIVSKIALCPPILGLNHNILVILCLFYFLVFFQIWFDMYFSTVLLHWVEYFFSLKHNASSESLRHGHRGSWFDNYIYSHCQTRILLKVLFSLLLLLADSLSSTNPVTLFVVL